MELPTVPKPGFGETVLDLFKDSVIVQSLITLILLGVLGYRLAITGSLDEMPELWTQLTMLVVGYWFGAKGNYQAVRANRDTLEVLKGVTAKLADAKVALEG